MRILVLTQFYPPESCAASSRTAAVTAALVSAGHKVRVVTAYPSFPSGAIAEGYRAWRPQLELRDDIEVLRVPTYASPRLRAADRLLNWASVSIGATIAALASRFRYDCVYVTCPPVTLALPALAAAKIRRCPLFVDVRDSYPDVAVKMGAWQEDSAIVRVVSAVVRNLYAASDAVSTVTATVKEEVIARGADPQKTFVAPNGFDSVEPRERSLFGRTPKEFVVAFAGNIGMAAGIDVVLEAARVLRDSPDIRFVLAGDGAGFHDLKLRQEAYGLKNVLLLGAVDRPDAMAVLRDADLCVVPLKKGIHDSLPTKLFDALYMGRPVLVAGDGEAGDFTRRSNGGWSVPAEDPIALAQAIRNAEADRAACRSAGSSGRSYVVANWDRARGVAAIVDRIATMRS